MVVEIHRQIVMSQNTQTIAVYIETEREQLQHIVAYKHLHVHMLYLIVGAVAETQPFAEGSVSLRIDQCQTIPCKPDSGVECW